MTKTAASKAAATKTSTTGASTTSASATKNTVPKTPPTEAPVTKAADDDWRRLWKVLGAHREQDGVRFTVWAPNARRVQVDGDFNDWRAESAVDLHNDWSNGRWSGFVAGVGPSAKYKYRVLGADGVWRVLADPMAFRAETPPATASVVFESSYVWGDAEWLAAREKAPQVMSRPMSVYEVHLPSWRPGAGYEALAHDLVAHVVNLGFTHVEFLPVMEHPFGGSWGYQTTGFFAPTARLGDPDGLRSLIDAFHQAGISVILDWVPAHFPRDDWALARFDGTALYEHPDPRRGEHPDWGSLIFNFGRWEVHDFLVASALFWIEEFHADALRVDAVSSMLFLDYSRQPGQWEPNVFGGNANLEAMNLLRTLTTTVRRLHPGVTMIAEESSGWPGVTHPTEHDGLGFDLTWNLGWMNDTLDYLVRDPMYRHWHHDRLTFPTIYAFSERYILPLSHDEVVHGKKSLASKLPGDRFQQLCGLRGLYAYQWAFPGKNLLFMGAEFAQRSEWSEVWGLDWSDDDEARGVARLVADLNQAYLEHPALWARDGDYLGTRYIVSDADGDLLAFARFGPPEDGTALVCVANFSGLEARDRLIGLPWAGEWREVLNTDAPAYGGTGAGNLGAVCATDEPAYWEPASARVTVGPGAVVWLASVAPGASRIGT
jgi:1,4-alpha-glucan branching enzyme